LARFKTNTLAPMSPAAGRSLAPPAVPHRVDHEFIAPSGELALH
jgi:hypothetical protein